MKTFVTDISASTGRNDFIFICGFGMVTCTVSALSRLTAHLLPVYHSLRHAKNTPTRSFVSNSYISQHSLPENAVKTGKILKSNGKQEEDVQ
jgi:hypothetical protein